MEERPLVTFGIAFSLHCLCTVGEKREFLIILFSLYLADADA